MANPNDPQTDRGYLGKGGFHVPDEMKPPILQNGEHGSLFAVKLQQNVQHEAMSWHAGQTAGFNFEFARDLVKKGAANWSDEMPDDMKKALIKLLGEDPFPKKAEKAAKI
jgi:hypothetical protein